MLGSNSVGFRRLAMLAGVALLTACAGTTVAGRGAPNPPDRIGDVRVDSGAEATVITLLGLEHPVFTAFAQGNPDRVIVDLPSVGIDPG